jgi:glycosyltransferase involved in cell wall biosynthesis
MPVFNGEPYIRQAIESVLAQEFEGLELLISDNASTDGTNKICQEYALSDSRVRVILHKENRGAFWNFKFVASHARGKLFLWLAHDDFLDPRFLRECVEHLNKHSQDVLVCSDFLIVDGEGKQLGLERLESIRRNIEWTKRAREFYVYPISNVYLGVYGLMRTSVCNEVLGDMREPRYLSHIEVPILARVASRGRISSLPLTLRAYRRHPNSGYFSEVAALASQPRLKRAFARRMHIARIRFDSLRVLLSSSQPATVKASLLWGVLGFYVRDSF